MQNSLISVYESALKLMAPAPPQETYATICHEALTLVQAEHASLFLVDDQNLLKVFSTIESPTEVPTPRKDGITAQVMKTGQPYVLSKDKHPNHPALEVLGVRSIILLPLIYNQKPLGVLSLRSERARQFTGRRLQVLKLFCSLCSLKLRNDMLYQELTEALKAQESFLSIASHELKTPMTSMVLYAQLIKEAAQTGIPLKKELASSFYKSVQRLNRLEKNLLDTNQIKHGSLAYHRSELDLKQFVKEVTAEFALSIKTHTLSFTDQATTALVLVDSDRLYQVLLNILNNAVKYSPRGSQLEVRLLQTDRDVQVSVRDYGQGIPPQHLEKIFKMYYRVDSQQQGLGLGLFVSKRIIEDHGGSLSIQSHLGAGTTVTIALPAYG